MSTSRKRRRELRRKRQRQERRARALSGRQWGKTGRWFDDLATIDESMITDDLDRLLKRAFIPGLTSYFGHRSRGKLHELGWRDGAPAVLSPYERLLGTVEVQEPVIGRSFVMPLELTEEALERVQGREDAFQTIVRDLGASIDVLYHDERDAYLAFGKGVPVAPPRIPPTVITDDTTR